MKIRIADLRRARGITQADLAHMSDIRIATLSELETGKGNPRLSTLEAVAAALGCTVVDLFEDGGDDPSASEIITALSALPAEERRSILTLVLRATARPQDT